MKTLGLSARARANCRMCAISGGMIAVVAIIGGALVWTGYTIAALVDERAADFSEEGGCTSYLWAYTLLLLVWTWMVAGQISAGSCAEWACHLVAEAGILSWGWWEIARPAAARHLADTASFQVCRIGLITHTVGTVLVLLSLGWSACRRRGPALGGRDLETGGEAEAGAVYNPISE